MSDDLLRDPVVRLLIALAIGLVLGLERERSKGEGSARAPAGIRTFALTSLLGGAAGVMESTAVIVLGAVFVGAAILIAYARSDPGDPGLTTEVALFLAYVLGVSSMRAPSLSAGIGVVAAALLAFRTRLHVFARTALNEAEILDGLVVGIAALVILPILPDRALGPFAAVNPAKVWRLAILVMAVGLASRLAVRLLGAHAGLALAALAGGFVSSTAVVGSMALLARRDDARIDVAAAGAVLANVASLVQLALVIGVSSPSLLSSLRWPFLAGGTAAASWGMALVLHARRTPQEQLRGEVKLPSVDLLTALAFAAAVAAVLIAVAFLQHAFGDAGFMLGAIGSGAADVHAAGISSGDAVARGIVSTGSGSFAVLGALTANTVVKAAIAFAAGARSFGWRVAVGLAVLISASWAARLVA